MWGSRVSLREISSGDGAIDRVVVRRTVLFRQSLHQDGNSIFSVPRYRASPAICTRRGRGELSIEGSVSSAFNGALAAKSITYLFPWPGREGGGDWPYDTYGCPPYIPTTTLWSSQNGVGLNVFPLKCLPGDSNMAYAALPAIAQPPDRYASVRVFLDGIDPHTAIWPLPRRPYTSLTEEEKTTAGSR